MGSIANILHEKLSSAFSPVELDIADESALHTGHAGARPMGQTHFRVRIVSPRFEGLNLLERHRLVHGVLSDELISCIHALSLITLAPAESRETQQRQRDRSFKKFSER